MDRNREARRATMAAANGLSRRRHRTNLRDSPEEDGPVELAESARLRDRGNIGKKDRERDRDRERERERDRFSRSSKRRRGDRLMLNREDGGEESSEESVNDEEEEDEDDGGSGSGHHVRMLPPNQASNSLSSSSVMNHSRRSFSTAPKVFRTTAPWKPADEIISASVPRKARSASGKRSHDCWVSTSGHVGDQILRQASTSPVRPGLSAMGASPVRPVSPTSSNASVRKKLKPNGPKQRPPKSSSKSTSSAQDDIEIEIAEVLYGLKGQPQAPSKHEALASDLMKFDPRDESKSTGDAKSRISSPISNSQSGPPQSSSVLPQNSCSSVTPLSATAPKRKKPRPVKYEEETQSALPVRSSPISSSTKAAEIDQKAKIEAASPNMEKSLGYLADENGGPLPLAKTQAATVSPENQADRMKPDSLALADSKPLTEETERSRDGGGGGVAAKEEPPSPQKESSGLPLDEDNRAPTKANSAICEIENQQQREEKFQIDLMAPPPSRSSPERDGDIDFSAVDPKPLVVSNARIDMKSTIKDEEKASKIGKEEAAVNPETEGTKPMAMEAEPVKPAAAAPHREKDIDLQLDLEKAAADNGSTVNAGANKVGQPVHKQQQPQQPQQQQPAQIPNSLAFPMSVAGWPSGIPPMGYMGPLPGVVSVDGSTVASPAIPPQLPFIQPRPKRCATHYYIARNIHYHQQFTRMSPFWSATAGSASLYGAKPCNLNVVPSTELHGHGNGPSSRSANAAPDKLQNVSVIPGKEKASQPANGIDAPRKQILLPQTLPAGAPSNILGPALFFPLSQQHAAAAAAASIRPGSVKSPNVGSSASAAASASTTSGASAAATATAMSFNYPSMPGGETQYLAILQNNPYPFPVPAHVGAAPTYRGSHAQPMPFFNGSFYPSSMLHPSQLQQQSPAQLPQSQSGHQNTSISSSSSSTQKHLQNQQQRPHGNNGTLQGFPSTKNQQSQPLQLPHNQHVPHQVRNLEAEGGEDSPSTADSRVSRASMSIYGPNFAVPVPPNFALMTPPQMGVTNSGGNNPHDKKQQQQLLPQQPGSKSGVDSLTSQAFAMSFSSINSSGSSHNLDISTLAQNHAILQSLPESTRHNYQIMAAAAAAQSAQHKKNYRASDEGKVGGNEAPNEDDRKPLTGKTTATMGQSIAFSRSDLADNSASALPGSNVVDSSARTLNLGSAASRAPASLIPAVLNTLNTPPTSQQLHRNQQQQIIQLQKQQQQFVVAAAARSKSPATSNGSMYSDHLPTSSSPGATKFPSSLSFPPNLIQPGSTQNQSPQWKGSARPAASQVPSSLTTTTTSSSLKNLSQQQGRPQQSQTHISFAANAKSPGAPQGQQLPNSNQSPSPPVVVGSPTTSSMSKSAGGSPRTATSSSTGNKAGQASLQTQSKNSPSVQSRKSSPVGTGILGNAQVTSSSGGTKHQLPQQQQLPKQQLQQAQLFFSHPYLQVQAPHSTNSTSTASANSAYYLQRRPSDQQPRSQPPQGSTTSPSSGMLSHCSPVTLASASTCDPVKAVAVSNMKGAAGGLPSQGILHAAQFAVTQPSGSPHQLVPAGFSYVHAVPNAAVQVKPAEQKQPAAAREV